MRGKREVLEALARELSVEAVLRKYPGWTRQALKELLLEAARSYPADGLGAEEVVAEIDGSSLGNPGPAGCGVIFEDREGRTLLEVSRYLGRATNNVAEWEALATALEEASRRGWKRLRVVTDSELLARQLEGSYRVKSPGLRSLHERCMALGRSLESWSVEHVGRQRTARADSLARRAIEEASEAGR